MTALLQRVMAGREEQKKQRQMDLERLLQRSVGLTHLPLCSCYL